MVALLLLAGGCRDALDLTEPASPTVSGGRQEETTLRAARFVADRTALDFEVVPVGGASPRRKLTVVNVSETAASLGISSAVDLTHFQVLSSTCARTVKPKEACEIEIAAAPKLAGEQKAVVRFSLESSPPIELRVVGSAKVRIAKTGDGGGQVASSLDGAHCTDVCEATFTQPELVLRADDDGRAFFTGWSGDCKGRTCRLVLDGDKHVRATFRKPLATRLFTDAPSAYKPADILHLPEDRLAVLSNDNGATGSESRGYAITTLNADGRPLWQVPPSGSDEYAEAFAVDGRGRLNVVVVRWGDSGAEFFLDRYEAATGAPLGRSRLLLPEGTWVWYAKPGIDGGIMLTGPRNDDGHVTFVDLDAQVRWSVTVPCEEDAVCNTGSLDYDAARGVLVVGEVSRYNPDGLALRRSKIWTLSTSGTVQTGALLPLDETAMTDTALIQWTEGGYVAGGEYGATVTDSASYGWVGRFDSNARPIWLERFGSGKEYLDVRHGARTREGGIVLVGYEGATAGVAFRPFVRLQNGEGTLGWTRTAAQLSLRLATAFYHRVAVSNTGTILIAGGNPNGSGVVVHQFFQ